MLKLSRTHSILAIAAALASLLPAAARAQKPALTQNIDEKGRTPYYDTEQGTCFADVDMQCFFYFKPVPAGYRLVITHASAQYRSASSSLVTLAGIVTGVTGQSGNYPYTVYLPAPTANGQNTYTYSSPITAYVEASQTPLLYLYNSQAGSVGTISGYLVALNE